MIYTSQQIVRELYRYNIINEKQQLTHKYRSRLFNFPELAQLVVAFTAYLRYNASLAVRIRCIILNISEQPTCTVCGEVVEMRESGRFKNTFPKHCSAKCVSSDSDVVRLREETNMRKYGVRNPLLNK